MELELIPLERVHVACDTGILWRIIDEEAPWLEGFVRMAAAGVAFSLADHATGEITHQLDRGKISGADYVRGITQLARFVSPEVPILPGKAQLLKWCDPVPDAALLREDRQLRLATWELLRSARSIADFRKTFAYCCKDDAGGGILLGPLAEGKTSEVMADERADWIDNVEEPRPGYVDRPWEERRADLAGDLDSDSACRPPLSVRLDAALRHEDEIIRRKHSVGSPLDPRSKKRQNDGIDYNMSYVFMKRILLCVSEEKYPKLIRSLGSYQSGWIFQPSELVQAWENGTLARPAWPS